MSDTSDKAVRIELFSFRTPTMRAFHLSWVAFFLCFFAWFAIAPLTAVIRDELKLTKDQIANTIIASVAITIFARLLVGWLCDRYGPRRTYTWLLALGSLPVMGIGLSYDYTTFLLFRLAIGAIGASFVITQYHTSAMFAPNCVGTANATTAGWGNLGGGVTQVAMPLIFAGFLSLGLSKYWSWRLAMIVPGLLMLVTAAAYWMFTQDTPNGRARVQSEGKSLHAFVRACGDRRVWALALIYGASFGIEITIHNIAAIYFKDTFNIGLKAAGLIAGSFGLLAIFARSLGGIFSDRAARRFGLRGRSLLLGGLLLTQGLALLLFAQAGTLWLAVASLIIFGLFVHLSCGATYGLVPFINPAAVGAVAGVVGAGGNVGAVLSGFLLKGGVSYETALLAMGGAACGCSLLALIVCFSQEESRELRVASPEFVADPNTQLASSNS